MVILIETDSKSAMSRFYSDIFLYKGEVYSSVEHAYQVFKCANLDDQTAIKSIEDPYLAYLYGRNVQTVEYWDNNKIMIRRRMLMRFFMNSDYKEILCSDSGNYYYSNTDCDTFWGICMCPIHKAAARNEYGKLICEIRGYYKK